MRVRWRAPPVNTKSAGKIRLVKKNQKFGRVIIDRLKAHSELLNDTWILSVLRQES